MVFTGGNDGMLHAFRLGKLNLSWTGKEPWEKAKITNPVSGTTLGDEAWAFIPKNALPYLKYLKDPDYCHLYYTDLAPYVIDASLGTVRDGDPDRLELEDGPHRRDADRRGVRQRRDLHGGEQLREDPGRRKRGVLLVFRPRRDGSRKPGPCCGNSRTPASDSRPRDRRSSGSTR